MNSLLYTAKLRAALTMTWGGLQTVSGRSVRPFSANSFPFGNGGVDEDGNAKIRRYRPSETTSTIGFSAMAATRCTSSAASLPRT
jgi:hypothetical protein